MAEHYPLGFDNRFPGRRKVAIPHTALNSNGPFHKVSSDGHEKLGKQALDMGDIGLPIYSRTTAAIGHLYLDFIETRGAIPIQLKMEKGHAFAPDINPEIYPVCRLIKSVHNTIIEGFWRWFKEKKGLNLKTVILVGKQERIFSPIVEFHLWVQLFCSTVVLLDFVPLLQAELDEFRRFWNHHRVRSQPEKNMPSGHVPYNALDHPQNYGGLDHRIPVPQEAVNDLRKMVTENIGPREDHLSWVSNDFNNLAHAIYKQIGKPELSLSTAWDGFQAMLEPMANIIEVS
ncbi:hypothetical protein DFH09DRAFT_1399594 [Mycena vulgaris]|nr:hypothetical protein DFH09DRAFT_1399594 [Mycena vulgaris]